jgi:hypothetical protein
MDQWRLRRASSTARLLSVLLALQRARDGMDGVQARVMACEPETALGEAPRPDDGEQVWRDRSPSETA